MKQSTTGIPGYDIDKEIASSSRFFGELEATPLSTSQKLLSFLTERDTVALLAKTSAQFLFEQAQESRVAANLPNLQQAELELLQILVLKTGIGKAVPTSPTNMVRLWRRLRENLTAYTRNLRPVDLDGSVEQLITNRVRIQTLFYRNVFSSWDAKQVVPALLRKMDAVSEKRLGYRVSEFSTSLFTLFELVGDRFNGYMQQIRSIVRGERRDDIIDCIEKISDRSETAKNAWRFGKNRFTKLSDLKVVGFQISELAWESVFIFDRIDLETRFGVVCASNFLKCAIKIEEIPEVDLSRIYFDNPVWSRPFILLDENRLFVPIPGLIVSFPFLIIERLIGSDPPLLEAYSDARSEYLEEAVRDVVKTALPSARIFSGVTWRDPSTGLEWEHDVLAVLGNQIFIFEAKSGKLKAASRRGGLDSLKTNFRKLFLEPGRQASRLEDLLLNESVRSSILKDKLGSIIDLDLSTPYVIHKFGICIEHFPGLTTSRHYFEELGLLTDKRHWAPIFSLSELRMLSDFLDTEASFFHYLTRRSTIEDTVSFLADEQDLLSMYLLNGFCIDFEKIAGKEILLRDADQLVRIRKKPRALRNVTETVGVFLPPPWNLIIKQVYKSNERLKFAMLEAIMNQSPPDLLALAKKLRAWKAGFSRNDNLFWCKYVIGEKIFVVAIHLMNVQDVERQGFLEYSRGVGKFVARESNGTDCVIVHMMRKSMTLGYDGISLFRFRRQNSR